MEERDHHRIDDRLIGQLLQKLQDSIELSNEREKDAKAWRTTHEETSLAWRKTVDDRLRPMDEFLKTANISWKLVLGAIAFTATLFKCFDWVRAHFK